MKKKQDHILWTLESKSIDHEQVDISDPQKDDEKKRMNEECAEEGEVALPPQIFNDEDHIAVSGKAILL